MNDIPPEYISIINSGLQENYQMGHKCYSEDKKKNWNIYYQIAEDIKRNSNRLFDNVQPCSGNTIAL